MPYQPANDRSSLFALIIYILVFNQKQQKQKILSLKAEAAEIFIFRLDFQATQKKGLFMIALLVPAWRTCSHGHNGFGQKKKAGF